MSEPYWSALGGGVVDYEGAWAPGTQYAPGDVVRYLGVDYLAVNPSLGVNPGVATGLVLPTIGFGTSFPASPVDGDEYILTDSITAPTYAWRFRYVAAKASNKWVYIGGGAKESYIATGEASSATSNADLTTVGPSFTLPRAGDYDCEFGCNITGGASTNVVLYLVTGASTVLISVSTALYAGGTNAHNHKTWRAAGRAAGEVLKLQYATAQSTPTYSLRYLRVTPVALT